MNLKHKNIVIPKQSHNNTENWIVTLLKLALCFGLLGAIYYFALLDMSK